MRLIGMYDSPYVRRVAITLHLIELPFAHDALSVFSTYDAFAAINPVVKAPTLVTDDGVVLMESGLILEHLARVSGKSLAPVATTEHAQAQRIIGLALAACEKSVQIIYERNLRPKEKQHAPWLDRVQSQLLAAYGEIESSLADADPWFFAQGPLQADITTAVAWAFTQHALPGLARPEDHPRLAAFSNRAERLDVFRKTPIG